MKQRYKEEMNCIVSVDCCQSSVYQLASIKQLMPQCHTFKTYVSAATAFTHLYTLASTNTNYNVTIHRQLLIMTWTYDL